MNECSAYVGLDVHKDTIVVAVAMPGREEPKTTTSRGSDRMKPSTRLPC